MTKTNKYWETEEAIVTVTDNMEIHHFREAEKLQIYGRFELEGQMYRTKAVVLDTNNIAYTEAIQVIRAITNALLLTDVDDKVVEAFADHVLSLEENTEPSTDEEDSEDDEAPDYSEMSLDDLRKECKARGINFVPKSKTDARIAIEMLEENDAENVEDEELNEVLDQEFEDEVQPASEEKSLDALTFKELKALCKERNIPFKSVGESKASLIAKLEKGEAKADNDESTAKTEETADNASEIFMGKYLTFNPETMAIGIVVQGSKRTKAYKEAKQNLESVESWLEVELVDVLNDSLTTSGKNKGCVNDTKFSKNILEWIKSFDADKYVFRMLDEWALKYHHAIKGVNIAKADVVVEHYFMTADLMQEFIKAMDEYFIRCEEEVA